MTWQPAPPQCHSLTNGAQEKKPFTGQEVMSPVLDTFIPRSLWWEVHSEIEEKSAPLENFLEIKNIWESMACASYSHRSG